MNLPRIFSQLVPGKDYSFWEFVKGTPPPAVEPDVFRAKQLRAQRRVLPALLVGQLLFFGILALLEFDAEMRWIVHLWIAGIGSLTFYQLIRWWQSSKMCLVRASSASVHRAAMSSFTVSVLWAILPIITHSMAPPTTQVIILAMLLNSAGAIAFNLARIPLFAIACVFVLCLSCLITMVSNGLTPLVPTIIFGAAFMIVMTAVILNMQHMFVNEVLVLIELRKQRSETQRLLSDFQTGTKDWLWEMDHEGKITYGSPRFAQMINLQLPDIIGQPFYDVYPGCRTSSGWQQLMVDLSAGQTVTDREIYVTIDDDLRCWLVSARPLLDKKAYRGITRDITELKKKTEAIEKATTDLEEVNAAKSKMLSTISHELRSPLNAIYGFSGIIKNDTGGSLETAQLLDYAENIHHSAEHLLQLITNIIDLTRIERDQLRLQEQEVDLNELVDITCRMLGPQAVQKGIVVKYTNSDPKFIVNGDLTRLKQIILNLLTNAIKFTDAISEVDVSISQQPSGDIDVIIRDSGIGMDEATLESILRPFYQAKEMHAGQMEGLGLGLYISHTLARLHDGELKITSASGIGTTARLVLPKQRIVSVSGPQSNVA